MEPNDRGIRSLDGLIFAILATLTAAGRSMAVAATLLMNAEIKPTVIRNMNISLVGWVPARFRIKCAILPAPPALIRAVVMIRTLAIMTSAVLLNPMNALSGERMRKKISARTTKIDTRSTESISIEKRTTAAIIMMRVMRMLVSGMPGIILDNPRYIQVN